MSVTARPLVKASLSRIRDGEVVAVFPFQFNPETLRRNISVEWTMLHAPGTEAPIAVFNHIQSQEIDFTLLLDARENYDDSKEGIRAQLDALESCVSPDPDVYFEDPSLSVAPSDYRLTVGPRTWPVVVSGIRVQEKMWNRDLVPVRAEVDMQLRTVFVDSGSTFVYLNSLRNSRARAEG